MEKVNILLEETGGKVDINESLKLMAALQADKEEGQGPTNNAAAGQNHRHAAG